MTEEEYEELGKIEREKLVLYNLVDCYNYYIEPYLVASRTLEKEIARDTLLRDKYFERILPYRRYITNFEYIKTVKHKIIDFSKMKLLFNPVTVSKEKHREQYFLCHNLKKIFQLNVDIKKKLGKVTYFTKFIIDPEDYISICSYFNREYIKMAIHTGYKLTLHSDFGHIRIKRRINRDVMEAELFSKRRKVVKSYLDFIATNEKKKEFLEKGIKPLVRFKDTYRNIIGTNGGEDFYIRYVPEFVIKIRFLGNYGKWGKIVTSAIYYYPVSTLKRYLTAYKKENPEVENLYLKY